MAREEFLARSSAREDSHREGRDARRDLVCTVAEKGRAAIVGLDKWKLSRNFREAKSRGKERKTQSGGKKRNEQQRQQQ